MNNLIQDNLFFIIVFLLLIILLLIGVLVFVIFKLLSHKQQTQTQPQNQTTITVDKPEPKFNLKVIDNDEVKSTQKILKRVEAISERFYCKNHPETASSGSCLICEEVFCENCLIEHEGMYFCREHFKIFANHKWVTITDVKTTPDTPEDGLYVWDFKRHLWTTRTQPTFVLTHYKINVEDDFIESYVQLNVIEKDAEDLKREIETFRK